MRTVALTMATNCVRETGQVVAFTISAIARTAATDERSAAAATPSVRWGRSMVTP